jgi:helicase
MLESYGRCKRAGVLFWISGRRLDRIEAEFSTNAYFGRIEYGDIRCFADTTRFHLQSASDIIAILLVDKNPQAELTNLLVQLEVGLAANALGLLQLPMTLTKASISISSRSELRHQCRETFRPAKVTGSP